MSAVTFRKRVVWLIAVVMVPVLALLVWLRVVAPGSPARAEAADKAVTGTVDGIVVGPEGVLAAARVRVRATENLTFSDGNGRFLLTGLVEGQEIEVTAWYTGHYIASRHVTPTVAGLTLTLRRYHGSDHPDYAWVSPISGTSPGACGSCHPMIVPQWLGNAHGGAINNDRFYSLYDGSDISGTVVISPGYLLDFPGTAGNCANCHAPGAAVDGYLTTPMDQVRGVITAGLHCDYCHKVGGVYLDPAGGTVYPNAPGVQSQQVLRPPSGDDIFFGPYDDIKDPDTYLPLISESQFCAPCHQFSFWGTPIYESYDEWLSSDYAAAAVTCQDCHMPPNGDSYFALPEVGGLPHPPETIPSHLQLGANSESLLQETVTMSLELQQSAGILFVTVVLTNTGAGHHVPTDHPGRQLILVVLAEGGQGVALDQLAGPTVPDWGGEQAGRPGQGFAKLLQDVASGRWPVVSYWKQSQILADNRISAGGSHSSTYLFAAPQPGTPFTITARLFFRRLFQAEMDARGWQNPDTLMEHTNAAAVSAPWEVVYLPLLQLP